MINISLSVFKRHALAKLVIEEYSHPLSVACLDIASYYLAQCLTVSDHQVSGYGEWEGMQGIEISELAWRAKTHQRRGCDRNSIKSQQQNVSRFKIIFWQETYLLKL